MNPGPVEEAGKTAGIFMQIMKDQPLSLALVIMNCALLVLLWWVARTQAELRSHDLDLIFKQQKEVQEILAKCVVPRANLPSWLPLGQLDEKKSEE